jgi:hypothetical protein
VVTQGLPRAKSSDPVREITEANRGWGRGSRGGAQGPEFKPRRRRPAFRVPGPRAPATVGRPLTEVLPEVAPARDEALLAGREAVRGGREAGGLDAAAEGQRAAEPQHGHVEVRGVRVVPRVPGDLLHARAHGLGAAELRAARRGHPRARGLEPAGQSGAQTRAPHPAGLRGPSGLPPSLPRPRGPRPRAAAPAGFFSFLFFFFFLRGRGFTEATGPPPPHLQCDI